MSAAAPSQLRSSQSRALCSARDGAASPAAGTEHNTQLSARQGLVQTPPPCAQLPPLSPPGSPRQPTPCGPAADSSSPPSLQPEIKASARLPSRCDSLFSAPGFSRNGLCYLWGWGPALLCAGIQTAAQTDRQTSVHTLAATNCCSHQCAALVSMGETEFLYHFLS